MEGLRSAAQLTHQLFLSVGSFETARGAAVAGPARGAARRMLQMYATDSQSGCQNCSSHSASFLAPLIHISNQEAYKTNLHSSGDWSWAGAGAGQELGRSQAWASEYPCFSRLKKLEVSTIPGYPLPPP